MSCDAARIELKALADGELAPLAAWRVRRHLARCPRCAGEFASLGRVHDLLRAGDLFPPAPAPAPAPRPLPRRAWGPALAGLAVGAAVVAGTFWHHFSAEPRAQMAAVHPV